MGTLADTVRGDKEVMKTTQRLAELFSKADLKALETALKAKDYKGVAQSLNIQLPELESMRKLLTKRGVELASQFPELKNIRKGGTVRNAGAH